ncbi:unnamed protein product [Schistosoma margrebowiei]|uniref:Uncharacterized protein n=1 Tax=Schistosoma margrebowiei TaxID=48269 RepID=A0A3P8EIH0_9TREM|nr:unnamed protein product [Schistosoma margrebowiei]
MRARRLECKQRIETIEATIRQKNVLLSSLEAASEQGDESYCLLLKKYESQIRELESKVIDLEREKSKLLAEHSNEELKDSKTQREARLKTMEQELNQTRRQLTELSRLKKAKEAREAECLRLRTEIQSLKTSMIRSAKQLKEESSAYRKWRKEKETETVCLKLRIPVKLALNIPTLMLDRCYCLDVVVGLAYRDEATELYWLEQPFLKVLPCQTGRLKSGKIKSNKPKVRRRSCTTDCTEV